MTTLPTIAVPSCDGCGACCAYAGVPPGYGKFYLWDAPDLPDDFWTTLDGLNWQAMPEQPRAELLAYRQALDAGTAEDRNESVLPCLWLDENTRQCRHYEWRPQICRDFKQGSPGCLSARHCEGIDTSP